MAQRLRLVPADEVARYRLEAGIEEDGVMYLVLHGESNDNGGHLKRPFNPHVVNGLDDGDPSFLAGEPDEHFRLTSDETFIPYRRA